MIMMMMMMVVVVVVIVVVVVAVVIVVNPVFPCHDILASLAFSLDGCLSDSGSNAATLARSGAAFLAGASFITTALMWRRNKY